MKFSKYYKSINENVSTTAPSSVSTGQFQDKLGKPAKRKISEEEDEKKNKIDEESLWTRYADKVLYMIDNKGLSIGLKKIGANLWKNDNEEKFCYSDEIKDFVRCD